MRLIALFFLFSCSTSAPLKYKYSFSKRYPASLTREDVVVSRIEGEVKHPVLFASGMDSTQLVVRLFDKEGNPLTDVDPNDLRLSSSEDIKAKTFVLKQGVYKAEILPKVKSRRVQLRVDWREKVMGPLIVLETTTSPLKDSLLPLNHEYFQSRSNGEITVTRGSASPENFTEGFSFENMGNNRIVDTLRHKDSQRSFHFDYLEQARQNLSLMIDDAPNDMASDTMHSLFMFFPRKQLPVVEQLSGTIDVTLPNGEKIVFQKDSKEIVDGVFAEGPVDGRSERFKRHYADLKYQGKGVILRANARGQMPQLGEYEELKIDLEYGITGSGDVLIINGITGQRCRRPKNDFWDLLDVSPIEFKFPTDKEFNQYLKKNCGFELPKF